MGITFVWEARHNHPPSSNFATLDVTGSGQTVLDFDASTVEKAYFCGVMPASYAGGTITIKFYGTSSSGTSSNVVMTCAFDRKNADSGTLASNGFASAKSVTIAAPGTAGVIKTGSISFSQSEADSVAAGDAFVLEITRDVDHASDGMTGDWEFWQLELSA